jgi:hypothetical protein
MSQMGLMSNKKEVINQYQPYNKGYKNEILSSKHGVSKKMPKHRKDYNENKQMQTESDHYTRYGKLAKSRNI